MTTETGAPPTKPLVSIVLTSFNDEPIIRPFYDAIVATLEEQTRYHFELIYVDDGSTDGSQETLAALALADARVTYIEFARNFGQGRAQFAGLKTSRGDIVVVIDGDYQYDPAAILQLADALTDGEYDMVSGVRINRGDNPWTLFTSKLGHMLINYALRTTIQDFGAAKALTRSMVDKVLEREHAFSDVYAPALSLRPRLIEIPLEHKSRPAGTSHWNLWMRLRVCLDLYVEYGNAQFDRPFQWGAMIGAAGPLVGAVMLAGNAMFRLHISALAILAFSVLVSLFGLNVASWALLMSFQVRNYKQSISKVPYIAQRVIEAQQERTL